MTTTILKVLRDSKLTDGTLFRLGITGEHIELSTTRGLDNILSAIHLPDTIETALDLMRMGDMLLRKNLEKDLGKAVLTNSQSTTI